MIIPIYRGDDTNFNNALWLSVNVAAGFDLSGFTAEFSLGSGTITQTAPIDETGHFEIVLTAKESVLLPLGEICGAIVLMDTRGRRRTIANDILFNVTDKVTEANGYSIFLDVPQNGTAEVNISAGGMLIWNCDINSIKILC